MFRDLKAIEIAEGALLADIAVLFQLLAIYLPIGGQVFRLLTFIVFAVLVLRRGLYVGVMSLCVALFVVTVIVGTHSVIDLFLECAGGLFLGVTMKRRMRLLPLLLIGVTCGALAFYGVIILTSFIFAVPLSTLVDILHSTYKTVISLIDGLAAHAGLVNWWRHNIYPGVSSLADVAFRYWALSFYVGIWVVLCPIVFVVYVFTNSFVRLLGYDVRPFPGGRVGRLLRRLNRRSIRLALRWGIIKGHRAKA
ncbi:MAG: hypothetical protein JO031_07080 [Ktedonobacteraceae bacterium]|nr:hypothetical protein [Ktedonobacteraceae bacterium]